VSSQLDHDRGQILIISFVLGDRCASDCTATGHTRLINKKSIPNASNGSIRREAVRDFKSEVALADGFLSALSMYVVDQSRRIKPMLCEYKSSIAESPGTSFSPKDPGRLINWLCSGCRLCISPSAHLQQCITRDRRKRKLANPRAHAGIKCDLSVMEGVGRGSCDISRSNALFEMDCGAGDLVSCRSGLTTWKGSTVLPRDECEWDGIAPYRGLIAGRS
jgi:hypothetical protein